MPRGRGEVDVAPLREAFLASGRTAREVAVSLGWMRTVIERRYAQPRRYRTTDNSRVLRTLGLRRYKMRAGYPQAVRSRVDYATAVKLAEAIGVDPVDVGL